MWRLHWACLQMHKKYGYAYPVMSDENRPLTQKQKAFVAAYTNPEGDGYMNASRAAAKVSPHSKNPALMGYKFAHKPHVQREIQARLEAQGFGLEGRIETLARIGRGEISVDKEVVTKNGQIITIQERPSMKERIHAIEVANKMDGTYVQQQLDADIARDEAAELRKRILREVTPGK